MIQHRRPVLAREIRYHDYFLPRARLPELRDYIEHGVTPRPFLAAVIRNSLAGVFGAVPNAGDRADLPCWVWFFREAAPPASWGSLDRLTAWCATGGLRGRAELGLGTGWKRR